MSFAANYPNIARAGRGLRSLASHMWARIGPLLLCLVGAHIWAAEAPYLVRLFAAGLLWGWALDLTTERAKAKEANRWSKLFAAMVSEERSVNIEVNHVYSADEETREAVRAGRDLRAMREARGNA